MSGYLFLTGGTGLLGRYLMRDLMQRGQRLALLVRGSKRETAEQRIESILQLWERQLGQRLSRPVLLEGDIRQPNLGLSDRDQSWVSHHCHSVMHSAASLTFHADGTGEPWITNFDGTRAMLDLCRTAGVRNLHYVSTAYVCGLREGLILESELDCGQSFRNDYEESKLQSEKLVRQADFLDQTTIYRPAVISGDSKTGYTNTYHGIYLYLRLMALFVPRQPIGADGRRVTKLRMPMTGEERRNVIPVDWVSKAMTELYMNPQAHGLTFHLAPDQCITPRQIIEAGYTYYQSTGVEWVGPGKLDPSTYNDLEAESLPGLAMYNNYETTDPTFDCTNLKRFAGHLPCPPIDEATLHTYLRFGEEDRWGKRRTEKPTIHWSASDYFASFDHATAESIAEAKARLGIELVGPGGGQWTLYLQNDGSLVFSVGVLDEVDSLLRLNTAEFYELISQSNGGHHQQAVEQLFPLSFAQTPFDIRSAGQRESAF